MRLEDCQYVCVGCRRVVDAYEEPSPGESEMVCGDCALPMEVGQ